MTKAHPPAPTGEPIDASATIRDRVRELRRVPASELKANPANWRTHPPAQARALADMLERIGFAGAALARETADGTLELIDGHLRAEVAGDEEVPVLIVDVDEDEAKLLLATLDPLSAMAGADGEKLTDLLQDVSIDNADLEKHLARFKRHGGRGTNRSDPDDVPDDAERRTAHGDLWLLGKHRLLCGDAREPADVDRLMDGEQADLVLTDPPYNVNIEGRTEEKLKIANDSMPEAEFEDLLVTTLGEMLRVSAPGAPAYCFHGDAVGELFRRAFRLAGWHLSEVLIWVKQVAVMSWQDYNWHHEPILYGWKPGAGHTWVGQPANTTLIDQGIDPEQMRTEELIAIVRQMQEVSTALRAARPVKSREHPTMKPVALLTRLINNSSQVRRIVLDTFAGSGSTLIAAEETGRRCYALELSPAYCDVILERYETFTGTEAVKAEPEMTDEALEAFVEAH